LACQESKNSGDPDLDKLTEYMTGSFSSAKLAEADTNFFDIRLEMKQIWKEREDVVWLYVEQAASWALDKPYRQRVFRLQCIKNNQFESTVFTFNAPLRFAGDWAEKIH